MSIILAEGKAAERKIAKKRCLVIGCSKAARKGKAKVCCKHEHELRKERDPYLYWYGVLRRNARRRRKVFTISLEYFTQFCKEHDYINSKGRKSKSKTIDRMIDELGYIEGNLQILENGQNVRKKYSDYWKHNPDGAWTEPPIDVSEFETPKRSLEDGEDLPF